MLPFVLGLEFVQLAALGGLPEVVLGLALMPMSVAGPVLVSMLASAIVKAKMKTKGKVMAMAMDMTIAVAALMDFGPGGTHCAQRLLPSSREGLWLRLASGSNIPLAQARCSWNRVLSLDLDWRCECL